METTPSSNPSGNHQPHRAVPVTIDGHDNQNSASDQHHDQRNQNQNQNPNYIINNINNNNNINSNIIITSNYKHNNSKYYPLLVTNFLCLLVGSVSSSLLSKYYFNHKGSSIWVSTWVQCGGFPLLFLPIFLPYYLLNSTQRKPFTRFTPKLLLLSLLIGLLLGLNNLLFSWGNSYLPVSTSSLLLSSQLAFNLVLSVLLVKQKITFSNLNCVILLVTSSVLLGLTSNHDKPKGLSRSNYFVGFFSTLGAGLLFALYLPLMEIIYRKVYCYAMLIEMQLLMEIAATALATAGMAAAGGFAEMTKESRGLFDKGEKAYWTVLFFNLLTWQLCFLGTAGMVFLTTSLTGGICMTALMAINVLGGVVVYGDDFGGVKAVSTVLSLWGFCSYVYGMYIKMRPVDHTNDNTNIINDNNNNDYSHDHPHPHPHPHSHPHPHPHPRLLNNQGMEMVPMVNDRLV